MKLVKVQVTQLYVYKFSVLLAKIDVCIFPSGVRYIEQMWEHKSGVGLRTK